MWSCVESGARLHDPCGYLASQGILWFYNSRLGQCNPWITLSRWDLLTFLSSRPSIEKGLSSPGLQKHRLLELYTSTLWNVSYGMYFTAPLLNHVGGVASTCIWYQSQCWQWDCIIKAQEKTRPPLCWGCTITAQSEEQWQAEVQHDFRLTHSFSHCYQ